MKFLIKIEDSINALLLYLGALLLKLVPRGLKRALIKFKIHKRNTLRSFKALPSVVKMKIAHTKDQLAVIDLKTRVRASIAAALPQGEAIIGSKWKKLKLNLSIPFYLLASWLKGLTVTQSLLLLTFTGGSFLAGINIIFSSQRIMAKQSEPIRAPASVEEVVSYDRPAYYKETSRHLQITGLRLPVYLPELNELGAVDIDFTATLSNRQSRMYLEDREFQLRDHFILEVEPVAATFPLQDEGKEILRQKLLSEINIFLKAQQVEGQALDVELTYILAN